MHLNSHRYRQWVAFVLANCLLTTAALLSICISTSQAAPATDCPNVRVDQGPNSPFDPKHEPHIPIYNQTDAGTCYAYTAEQLIDFERFKGRSKSSTDSRLLSPHHLAYITRSSCSGANPDWDTTLDGGNLGCVLKFAPQTGGCATEAVKASILETAFPKTDSTDPELMRVNEVGYLQFIKGLFDRRYSENDFKEGYLQFYEAILRNQTQAKDRGVCLNEPIPDYEKLFDSFKRIDHFEFLHELNAILTRRCGNSDPKTGGKIDLDFTPITVSNSLGTSPNLNSPIFLRMIRDILNQGKPLGINYCLSVLKKGKTESLANPNLTDAPPTPPMLQLNRRPINIKQCGPHSSVVTGMRFDKGSNKCQVLIRNSWGTDCSKYHADWSQKKNCEGGSVWIDADVLDQNLYGASYIL